MAWGFVQSASSFGTQTGFEAVAYGSNVSAGNKLVVWTVVRLTTTATVKDGAGNSWTKLASIGFNGNTANGELALWALDCPAGDAGTAPTITATFTSNLRFGGLLIEEVSGLLAGNTSAMLDGAAGTASGTLSANGNAGPPAYSSTAASEWLAYGYGDNGGTTNVVTWTAPAGYTADANGLNATGTVDVANAYKNSTNGAETGHYAIALAAGTVLWGEILVAFKLAATTAASPVILPPVAPRPRPRPRAVVITPPRPAAPARQLAAQRAPVTPRPRSRARAVVIPPRQLLASPIPPTPGKPVLLVPLPLRPRPRGRALVITPRIVPPSPPPVAAAARTAADYDGKSWWKKRWILRL